MVGHHVGLPCVFRIDRVGHRALSRKDSMVHALPSRWLVLPLIAVLLWPTPGDSTVTKAGREHTTVHYDLYIEGDLDPIETGSMLEALHAKLTGFFGRAPEGRLRLEIYETQNRFLGALLRDRQPYESGGGLYGPTFEKVWLAIQPTEAYTRQLILHEATHQFHFLVATGNEFPSALWYTEGLAEFMGMANWDGHELEVGVIPAITLEDYPERARAAFDEIDWDLEAALEDRVSAGQAGSWALVHFLANQDRERFRDLGRRLERREMPGDAFRDVYGEVSAGLVGDFRAWLEDNRQPWQWRWNSWQQRGDWIEGESDVVAMSTLKETPRRLDVELQPVSGYLKGGLVFGYQSPDDFFMMTLWDDRSIRVVRRLEGEWVRIDQVKIEQPPGRDVLSVEQSGKGVRLRANGKLVKFVEAVGQVGLTVDGCKARFRPIVDGGDAGFARVEENAAAG